jgi:hypothetical protein
LIRRQNGTVSIHCLYPGGVCNTPDAPITRAYTYVDDTVVSN